MNKIFSAIISSPLKGRLGGVLFALLATTNLWAYDFQSGELYYNITSYSEPYTVEVTCQEQWSSSNYSGLTTVTIPKTVTYSGITYSVTSIGNEAFYACSSLASVTIPNSVTSIGYYAFYQCSSLTSITIPESVITIGEYAFQETPWYNSKEDGVIYIGKILYEYKGNMPMNTSIDIKDGTISISSYAFYNCRNLISITIPNSVINIGYDAFNGCTFVKDKFINHSALNAVANNYWGAIIVDKDVDGLLIRNDTIMDCRASVTTVTIPDYITCIGDYAFQACYSLTSVTIPNSVVSIGWGAFLYCQSLTSITIPESVITIGGYAFQETPWYNSKEDGVIYIGKVLYEYKGEMPANTSLDIIDGTLSISSEAFNGCSNLVSITIPESVTSIGKRAFSYCSALTSITIPESVTSVGESAFNACSSLQSVTWNVKNHTDIDYSNRPFESSPISSFTFGENVEHIPAHLCHNMDSLKSVSFPKSVKSIGYGAFQGCSSLKSVKWNVTNYTSECSSLFSGSPISSFTFGENVEHIPGDLCSALDSLTSIVIPNSVTSIGDGAFAGCSSLTSATIGNSVTSIGEHTFSWCSSLLSITIPNNVTSIGHWAFYNCSSLTDITISENLTHIGDGAFSGCTAIKSVTWNAKNCKDSPSFENRSSIQSFTFGENVEYIPVYLCIGMGSLKSITIPNSVDSIGHSAFAGCSSLTSVTIGSRVKSIGSGAFEYSALKSVTLTAPTVEAYCNGRTNWLLGHSCTAPRNIQINGKEITEFIIPNSIDSIHDCLFIYCSSLTSVTIPNSVDNIGEYAFAYCDSLTSITIPESVMSVGASAFHACSSLKSVTWNVKNHTDFEWSKWPFYQESPIQSFNFGENVEHIPAYICYSMDSLKSITISENVNTIGDEAFYSCSALNSVTWNAKNCSDLSSRTFYYSPISSFTFGENVEYIPAYLCYNQDSLRSVTIPNSVDSIGEYAFAYCDSLTSVAIGESVSKVGEYAFSNDFIKTVFSTPLLPPAIESNVFGWKVYDNATLHVLSSDYKTHDVWKQFDNIQVLDTIHSDGIRYKVINKSGKLLSESLLTEDSFNQFTRVSVAGTQTWRYDSQYGAKMSGFQDNVTHTNEDWFISPALDLEGCSSATLTFSHAFGPKSSIPTTDSQKAQYTIWVSNDFEGDVNAATWTELKGMIYGDTGWGFVSSGDITIPTENLKANCRVAWKYTCTTSSATWEIKDVSLFATIDTNAKPTLQVINGESPYSGDIVIPSIVKYMNADLEVSSISNIAFRDCSSLNSVTVENGVTTIEEYAFYNSSLTSISLPNTLTHIGYSAFRGCSSLISIAIPNGVTTIKNNTFSGCSSLTSATISNGVMAIEKYAFADCLSLNTISVPNSVTRIGQSTFKNCTSLVEVTLSNEMNTLEKETFQDCSSLKFVRLGGKLTTIGESVFSACTALNEITLPASVKSIGENAFAGCTKLYDIYCFAMEPPTAYESSFANYNAFLHVPCDNQRVYLLDILFGNFKYVECIEAETAPTDTVVVTPSFNDAEFIWPSNSSADSYTLAISKDGEIFCTLTFNANGQLTGIAFAPSRNGQHNAPAAAQTANGFAFTVTGLDEGANYTYDLLIQDRSGNTLQSYSGEFRTRSTNDRTVTVEYDAAQGQVTGAGTYLVGDTVTLTATPNDGYRFVRWSNEVEDNPYTFVISDNVTLSAEFEAVIHSVVENTTPSQQSNTHKLLRDGQFLILRDGKTYTITGQKL